MNDLDMKKKIFVTSLEIGEGAWRTNESKLKELYSKTADRKYLLVDDPLAADIILIGNLREGNWGEKVLKNEWMQKFPGKCFSISEETHPLYLNHGIYTNAVRQNPLTWQRVRTGAYSLYYDDFVNPFIRDHQHSETGMPEKKYLFSFIGRTSFPMRNQIMGLKFNRTDIRLEDSYPFDLWRNQSGKLERQKAFYQILLQSKFSLCPRGSGTNSIRLFESIHLGVAPIIISDAWKFPKGQDWKSFSIIIKQKHVKELEKIVTSYEDSYVQMGALASRCFEAYFSEASYFNYVVDSCLDIQRTQVIPEAIYWKMNHLYTFGLKTKDKLKNVARRSGITKILKRSQ